MNYIRVENNVKLAVYDINPTGRQTVFLIHGWPLTNEMYEYQLNELPKRGFRCVSIDLRGFGNSDAPWTGYSYDRLADDVFAVIRTLNIPSLTLVGFSMGGAIAIRYMARHGGYKVSKLALLSAAAPSFTQKPDSPYGFTVEQVNALIDALRRNRPETLAEFGTLFFASPVTKTFSDWFNRMALDATGYSTIMTAESLRDADLRADLARIRVETGIFGGVLDKICPFELALEMNRGIRDSKLFRFEQSGHGVFYDELEKFNREFFGFLEG